MSSFFKSLTKRIRLVTSKNTWQDAENLDSTHGYTAYIWIPEETHEIHVLKVMVFTEKFRAYSTGASGGGGHSHPVTGVTSAGGGAHSHPVTGVTSGYASGTFYSGRLVYPTTTENAAPDNPHAHDLDVSAYVEFASSSHDHEVSGQTAQTVTDHAHLVTGQTAETVTDHTHPITYGIYEEAITGRTLSASLYDPYGSLMNSFGVILTGEGRTQLDLSSYFDNFTPGIYELRLTASNRLRARLAFYELSSLHAY